MKVVAITQARVGSTRLPNKVLLDVNGQTLLDLHLKRLLLSETIDSIVVATTYEEGADKICQIAEKNKVKWHQGSTTDVLDRFYQAASPLQPDYIIRITSDCPLLDPALIDEVVGRALELNLDYYSNILIEEYPDGQDIEVVRFSALKEAWERATDPADREHVTPYIRKNCDFKGGKLFTAQNHRAPYDMNGIRMTVDELDDLAMVRLLVEELGTDKQWFEYANYIVSNSDKFKNQDIKRNEGYLKSLQNRTSK